MKPFELFTAEMLKGRYVENVCCGGKLSEQGAAMLAHELNAILNERGKRVTSDALPGSGWFDPEAEGDTQEALLLGEREIEK